MRFFGFLFLYLILNTLYIIPAYGYDPFARYSFATEAIRQRYENGEVRILLIPGHTKDSGGAEFRGVYERQAVVDLAWKLADLLRDDKNINLFVAREKSGDWAPWLSAYMNTFRDGINAFRENLVRQVAALKRAGQWQSVSNVYHNVASEQGAYELYSINSFANNNKIDIVIHVHLNDYAGRKADVPGKYSGFAVYIPSGGLPNADGSRDLAEAIAGRLKKFAATSDLPGESGGVVPDSELIAIGSNASRDGPSLLIEYGYIYEPPLRAASLREIYFAELAAETARAIFDYLGPDTKYQIPDTRYSFMFPLKEGMRGSPDVLALQFVLSREGLYPPQGKTPRDCPVTGNFGPCTKAAVAAFQEKYRAGILAPLGLPRGTGYVGPATLTKLNSL